MSEIAEKDLKTEYFRNGIKAFDFESKIAINVTSNEECAEFSSLIANTTYGVLESDVYRMPTDKTEVCFEIIKYHITVICRKYLEEKRKSEEANVKTKETWIYASPSFLRSNAKQVIEIISEVVAKYKCEDVKNKICLSFPKSVLWLDRETLKGITALKEFGLKISITDVGDRLCPLTVLGELEADYVTLETERLKPKTESDKTKLVALIEYLKANGLKVFGSGAQEDREEFRKFGLSAYWLN